MNKNASDLYYLGDYESAVSCTLTLKNAPFLIGAAVFRGEHAKARRIYKEYKGNLSEQDLVFSNFHMGISYIRTSNYKEAKEILLFNWKKRKSKNLSGVERFFIYQGLSFFRFFFSKHLSSLYFSELAEVELLNLKTPPDLLVCLVKDLIAHNYFQLGKPAKGERFLREAIETAKKKRLVVLYEEFTASLLIYKSQYSTDLEKNIKSLDKLLKKTSEANDYTRSELVLQISKLFYLRGAYKKANDFLIKNFNTIYKNDNKRKIAKLNTLLAQFLLPKNQLIEALSLLKVAKSNLSDDVDFNLLAPILGTEIIILKSLGESSDDQMDRLSDLLRQTDKGILLQIQSRKTERPSFNEEDQVGILFDKVSLKDESVLEEIIKKEFFHLASLYFSPLESKRNLIIHPKNTGVFLFSEEGISFNTGKVSKNQYKFLYLLDKGPQTKEDLIKEIWGYSDYDPFRHDHLVYTLVRRLRILLGDKRDWVLASEDQYSLHNEVKVHLNMSSENPRNIRVNYHQNTVEVSEDINYRQIQILEGIITDGFSANNVAEFFNTTRMTSYRDLDDLLKRGLIQKRGKGRGTRYFLS